MAVNVLGGGLDFTASIDTSNFEKQITKVEDDIKDVLTESAKLAQKLETIRGKIGAHQDLH
jgi:hypothetical protein